MLIKSAVSGLNDYRPVALTPILMNCFDKLVLLHINNSIPVELNPHQFVFRSTEDAMSTVLHSVFTHLEENKIYRINIYEFIYFTPINLNKRKSFETNF